MSNQFVFILPDVEGGVASVVENLVLNSVYKCRVILIASSTDTIKRSFGNAEVIRFKVNHLLSMRENARRLKRYIPEDAVIVANDGGFELNAIRLMKMVNPVVYILHGDFNYYYRVIEKNIGVIDGVITVSNYTKNILQAKYPNSFESKPIECIHFPVPMKPLPFHSFDLSNDSIRIVFVGSLIERKGVHNFPAFVDEIKKIGFPFTFTIIGDGELKDLIVNLEEQHKEVTFLGSLPNDKVIDQLIQHDILFLPSSSEGLPVSIVEAMRCGLAIIASDINSGIPEVVIDGKTGFLKKDVDIQGFAKCVSVLSGNRNLLNEMKGQAYLLSNKLFNEEKQSQFYFDFFSNIETKINLPDICVKEVVLSLIPLKLLHFYNFKIRKFFI